MPIRFQRPLRTLGILGMITMNAVPNLLACPPNCTDIQVTLNVGSLGVSASYTPCGGHRSTKWRSSAGWHANDVESFCAEPDTSITIGQWAQNLTNLIVHPSNLHPNGVVKIDCTEDTQYFPVTTCTMRGTGKTQQKAVKTRENKK